MRMVLMLSIVAALFLLNLAASIVILRDAYSERRQKILQTVLVWLVPIIGALLVFGVHRQSQKPSGAYRRYGDSVGETYGHLQLGVRATIELVDGD